eukprot:TRINITY_DN6067_c0_g1_i2.p1 TRINITY_DN6067_c0_g1~~TRINITY_DN6067_c0_g1_i2.p1  ORF type:complete len:389 (+),score=120.19 TRINITY_DN6067_c0_g1_i2:108-1274(+)
MKKVVIEGPGGFEKLKVVKDLPLPKPKKGEILVEVKATGVNYADICVRMGFYGSAQKYVGWPITPGFEFSGVVIEVGEEAEEKTKTTNKSPENLVLIERENEKESESENGNKFKVGDKVVGVVRFGAYSSHVVVPTDQVLPLSSDLGLSFEAAAAFPSVFLTAYYGLFELAHPKKNDLVLVHSAAGGVGGSLVQLCKIAGCKVVGVVGKTEKVQPTLLLGADYVIDKSKENLWQRAKQIVAEVVGDSAADGVGDGFDLIFDANGVETLANSYANLATGGKLIVYGFHTMLPKTTGYPNIFRLIWDWWWTPTFNPLNMTSDNKSVLAFNLSYMFSKKEIFLRIMNQLFDWVREGKIKHFKVTSYPLENVVEAHKDLQSGATIGKLVLIP